MKKNLFLFRLGCSAFLERLLWILLDIMICYVGRKKLYTQVAREAFLLSSNSFLFFSVNAFWAATRVCSIDTDLDSIWGVTYPPITG